MRIDELFEAFDSTHDLEWRGGPPNQYSHGSYDTSFWTNSPTSGREKYLVDITQDAEPEIFTPEVWCVSFRQASTPGYRPTANMGSDAVQVLGGVVHSIEEFIKTHQPAAIGLTGKQKDRLGKLYVRMANNLRNRVSDLNYEIMTAQGGYGKDVMDIVLLYRVGEPEDYIVKR